MPPILILIPVWPLYVLAAAKAIEVVADVLTGVEVKKLVKEVQQLNGKFQGIYEAPATEAAAETSNDS